MIFRAKKQLAQKSRTRTVSAWHDARRRDTMHRDIRVPLNCAVASRVGDAEARGGGGLRNRPDFSPA